MQSLLHIKVDISNNCGRFERFAPKEDWEGACIVFESFKLEYLPSFSSFPAPHCEGSAQYTSMPLWWLFDLSRSLIVWLLVLKYYKVIKGKWSDDLSSVASKFWQGRTSRALWVRYVSVIVFESSTYSCHSIQLWRPHLFERSLTLRWLKLLHSTQVPCQ